MHPRSFAVLPRCHPLAHSIRAARIPPLTRTHAHAQALKFMRHGRRETLSCDDINYALRARACEPLYGFSTSEPPRFCRAANAPGERYTAATHTP